MSGGRRGGREEEVKEDNVVARSDWQKQPRQQNLSDFEGRKENGEGRRSRGEMLLQVASIVV